MLVFASLAREFRERAIPCDVIWIDIHYMDEYKVFTFDPERFPGARMAPTDYLHELRFQVGVDSRSRRSKQRSGTSVYDEGVSEGHFLRDSDGREHHESTWPGDAAFPDYTRPETQDVVGATHDQKVSGARDGRRLGRPQRTLSDSAARGGASRGPTASRGRRRSRQGSHAQYHNVYGLLMAKATEEAMRASRTGAAPFCSFALQLPRRPTLRGDLDRRQRLELAAPPWVGADGVEPRFVRAAVFRTRHRWVCQGRPRLRSSRIGSAWGPSCHSVGPITRSKGTRSPGRLGQLPRTVSRVALERRYRLLPYLYTAVPRSGGEGAPRRVSGVLRRPNRSLTACTKTTRSSWVVTCWSSLDCWRMARLRLLECPAGEWRPFSLAGEDPGFRPRTSGPATSRRGDRSGGSWGTNGRGGVRGAVDAADVSLDRDGKAEGRPLRGCR